MLAAIGFNNQSHAEMHEINHIRTNGLLTPEFAAIQTMRSQVPPKKGLALCHTASQMLGKLELFHSPLSPTPLPLGERGFW